MSLNPGARLAGYEIVRLLGAGGMGEVYQATDTRLGRTVAIKVLPAQVAGDPVFRQRFEREAQALAALHDPHISAVFDIGRQDGIDFVVMEYLDGQTLADRLRQGALPLGQAIDCAIQIADGLDKAHRQGIVHRDLKPGNIMLTKSGTKLLDFGLAKQHATPASAVSAATAAQTISSPLTATGTILGTFQYMAPEQVEGAEADPRSDIFALGAVLYEMITGKRAFDGKSQASVMAAILEREPPALSSIQPVAPRSLDVLVSTCLAKNPEDRWQSAHDVAQQLRSIAQELKSGVDRPAAVVTGRGRGWRTGAAFGIAGLVVGAGTASLLLLNRSSSPAAVTERLSIVPPADSPLRFAGGVPASALAISPDGRALVFASKNGLMLRRLDSRSVTALTSSYSAQAFFSPDGRWVAYIGDGGLRKVAVDGGSPVTLVEHFPGRFGFADWTDRGSIVFASDGPLYRVSADGGGTPEAVTTANDEFHAFPAAVRGRNAVLFTVTGPGGQPRVELLDLDSHERTVLVENARLPRYVASGHLLFQRDDGVFVAPVDKKTLKVTGPVVPLKERIRREGQFSAGDYAQLAISANGTMAYVPGEGATNQLGWVDGSGTFTAIDLPPDRIDVQRLSPDGTRIAYELYATSGTGFAANNTVLVYDISRKSVSRPGADRVPLRWPVWRPNGRELAVFQQGGAERGIYLMGLDGSMRLITSQPAGSAPQLRPGSWSPDGSVLAYTVQAGSEHHIWLTDADGKTPRLLTNKAEAYAPAFSPDGRWIAYASSQSGSLEVWVKGFPDGVPVQVSFGGGTAPMWRPDGKQLFFQVERPRPAMLAVPLTISGSTVLAGTARHVFDLNATSPGGVLETYRRSNNFGARFDIARDGRFLVARGADPENLREIVVVQNWFEELERMAPH